MGVVSGCFDVKCLDFVIINVVIIDWIGIFKVDIGVQNGLIVGIGKVGNFVIMDGVFENMVIGLNMDIIDVGGKILIVGGIDIYVYYICF